MILIFLSIISIKFSAWRDYEWLIWETFDTRKCGVAATWSGSHVALCLVHGQGSIGYWEHETAQKSAEMEKIKLTF